jgi:hypothetical protein
VLWLRPQADRSRRRRTTCGRRPLRECEAWHAGVGIIPGVRSGRWQGGDPPTCAPHPLHRGARCCGLPAVSAPLRGRPGRPRPRGPDGPTPTGTTARRTFRHHTSRRTVAFDHRSRRGR